MSEYLLTDLDMGKCFIGTRITEEITEVKIERYYYLCLEWLHINKQTIKYNKIRRTVCKKYYRQRLMCSIVNGLLITNKH